MVKFTATLDRFGKYKEKSGWTFIPISSARAQKLSSHKTAFRVKGKIDDVEINQVALVPMGDGDFILPVNGIMRKNPKAAGDKVRVEVEYDPSDLQADQDFWTVSWKLQALLGHMTNCRKATKTISPNGCKPPKPRLPKLIVLPWQ